MAPRPDLIVKALGKLTAKGCQGLAQALQAELSEGGAWQLSASNLACAPKHKELQEMAAKKPKAALSPDEVAVQERLQKQLKVNFLCLIGFSKEQNGGKIPGKNLLSQFMPQAPVGTDLYMLLDWGTSRWDEGGNYPIIDWVIALVLEENKRTPLPPNTDQAWLTQPSLKALFHPIWSKLKQQFEAEHDMAKKSRKDKWLLEGRLTEHRNTQYNWAVKGGKLLARKLGIEEDDIKLLMFSLVNEHWVREEYSWDDLLDEQQQASWWISMCKSDQLSPAQM
ncbi:hypothetical protein DACRYDRAFT_16415 [Dacryopinax primogenitus]|uniref:Uncharacterized protein n=1 Tax=Dacryopinax primogenitus (strain DJM 731) TaxID=1858805 RepID=M5FTS7_DACPD|nr:uncharacterized protein DACRYDRAFT_16415 [Dacryopinax primogenitus]EJU01061.1 hypothetical protein DACRYDRAFT_16415 [Dacryopinax primogenitus]